MQARCCVLLLNGPEICGQAGECCAAAQAAKHFFNVMATLPPAR